MDIKETFWNNVFWHIEHKGLDARRIIGSDYVMAWKRQLNPTLNTVAKIACKIGIDDYAILFEGWETV